MKIAVIGGGAAGIMASITAKRLNKNLQIDIFDANKSVGKKILASGNGRCNISNTYITYKNYLGEDPSFVEFALKEFDFKAFEKFCKSIGLLLDIKESSKVYPLSNEAKSVTKLLELALKSLNINVLCEEFIQEIEKDGDKFSLLSNDIWHKNYDKVLISSGLAAAPQLRASEIGLTLAQSFNHTFNPTYPSLVGLCTVEKFTKELAGVKKECKVSLYVDRNLEEEILGDVLFTSYGVSGFAILDISQRAVFALSSYANVELKIDFFPNININNLSNTILSLLKGSESFEDEFVVDILSGLIPNKLCKVILDVSKIALDVKIKDINTKDIKKIAYNLNSFSLKIDDTQGFAHAEASGGGVRTVEVDSRTYESKITKNLFFAGEVLDIVGNRGGFNLHFAWASGYLAGKSLAK